jgi:arylsulfatase A-like enzyme
MNRRTFLKSAATTASTPLFAAPRRRQPNLLFIIADEWRAQSTGYNGDTNVTTPVLDKFAHESVNFQNATSNFPVCCPARASIMTGQYPLTNGVFINDVELKPNAPTLAEVFAKAGYKTGYIGKWHLYGSPDGHYGRRLAPVPADKRLGFDYWKACECSHDYNHSLYYEGNDPTPRYWPGYDAFAQTDDACRFIESHAKGPDPFFLFLSWGPPHFPYQTAPEKYREMYKDRKLELRPNVPADRREEADKILRGYYAHMAALDECLERLTTTLERLNIAEDTIVVFTSDHGDMMLSQGLTTKFYPWDESVRIPFLLRYPRQFGRTGRRVHTPLNMPDMMPTLLSMAGLKTPGAIQGSDLSRVAKGAQHDDTAATAFLNMPVPITEARRYGIAEYRGLRSAQYTYVRSIHGPWLLYDNQKDPYQMHNLCNLKESASIQARMEQDLEKRLRLLKDDFLPAKDYVQRAGVGHYREVNAPVGHVKSPWGDWESTLIANHVDSNHGSRS